jgi:SagB-type dehydrogenase family enzyme
MDNTYSPSPWLRISPSSSGVAPDKWIADDLVRRRRWRLSDRLGRLLVALSGQHSRAEVVQIAKQVVGPASGAAAAASLLKSGLVIENHEGPDHTAQLARRWMERGWGPAIEYQLATHDYPCLDYEIDGFREDRARMETYLAAGPEPDRYKEYRGAPVARLLPSPQEAADIIAAGFDGRPAGGSLSRDGRMPVEVACAGISFALASVGSLTAAKHRPPFILRTSPSGGNRHPTEGYLLAVDLDGIEAAWYHVRPDRPACLERLEVRKPDNLADLFPATVARADFAIAGLLVLTSSFARNMFRYREPRTFRTVHMDAGHIAATAKIALSDLGWPVQLAWADRADLIEQGLGLHPLSEGYMATVALGHRPGEGQEIA